MGKTIIERLKGNAKDVEAKEKSNQKQWVKDWNNNKASIYIGGKSLSEIYKDEKILEDADTEQLEAIWHKYIIESVSEDERESVLGFMRQSSYLNILLLSLTEQICDDSKGEFAMLPGALQKRHFNIYVDNGMLKMSDRFEVDHLNYFPGGLKNTVGSENVQQKFEKKFKGIDRLEIKGVGIPQVRTKYYDPLMSAAVDFEFKQGRLYVKDVSLIHHYEFTETMVNKQGLLEKIKDFLMNLFVKEKKHEISAPFNVSKLGDADYPRNASLLGKP